MECKRVHERGMQGVPGEGHVHTSEGPLVHRNRFLVLSSDSDDAPLARMGIQSPEGGTTVPASSAAVAEYFGEFRPPAVTITEEPVHREFDMTLQDSDTESVGTQFVDHERNSTRQPASAVAVE